MAQGMPVSQDKLVGIWSADYMYGPGGMSDDQLILFSDGCGRLDFVNAVLCNAWTFRWTVPDSGLLEVKGLLAYELTSSLPQDVVKRDWDYDARIPFTVSWENTLSGRWMRVLRLSSRIIEGISDHFGFLRREVEGFEQPDFSYLKRMDT